MLALPALVGRRRADLIAIERRLPDPHRLTALARDAIGDRATRLRLAAPGLVTARRSHLDGVSHRLTGAAQRAVTLCRGKADRILTRMSDTPLRASLREARAHLSGLAPRLEAASPLALLQRGYVLVTTPAGQPVTAAKHVKPHDRLRLQFGDGEVDAVALADRSDHAEEADGPGNGTAPRTTHRRSARPPADGAKTQTSLEL
jgi:exodeoxyribonuclease VII large subunit